MELSEIESPFVYLQELDMKSNRVLKAGESLVSSGEWETLPEYGEEIKQIVAAFEHIVPLLEQTHERILAEQAAREAEKRAEEERQRLAREERLRREAEYEQAIQDFKTAFIAFQVKATWKSVNDALTAGEAVESNPLFAIDARRNAIGTQLATLRSKKAYLEEVRQAARELLAEQAQEGQQ